MKINESKTIVKKPPLESNDDIPYDSRLDHKIHAIRCLDYSLLKTITELKVILSRLEHEKIQVNDIMKIMTEFNDNRRVV